MTFEESNLNICRQKILLSMEKVFFKKYFLFFYFFWLLKFFSFIFIFMEKVLQLI